ncbi:fascin domain-containing protein [Actinacidiphila sp. ITFR-21]|uniref:fascin domain-containing protein n=1 Tax=Actinacidiphila sp. ITFR-21 TaxID=3075199 RepID=UPI0037D9EB31
MAWPDVRDYARTYHTGYASLGNGQPADLFSSYDQQTVDTRFLWLQQNGAGGVQGVYIPMFDEFNEFNEGNQIAKTAESLAWVPTNSGFSALDEDGTACSSDYYLRLAGDGGRMLKGQIALTATRPTPPVTTTTTIGGDTTPPGGTVVSLRARADNLYVTAENAGDQPLIANRAAIGAWEQFDLVTS